jgi:hypothetical protein
MRFIAKHIGSRWSLETGLASRPLCQRNSLQVAGAITKEAVTTRSLWHLAFNARCGLPLLLSVRIEHVRQGRNIAASSPPVSWCSPLWCLSRCPWPRKRLAYGNDISHKRGPLRMFFAIQFEIPSSRVQNGPRDVPSKVALGVLPYTIMYGVSSTSRGSAAPLQSPCPLTRRTLARMDIQSQCRCIPLALSKPHAASHKAKGIHRWMLLRCS